jgi:hypothetical protein
MFWITAIILVGITLLIANEIYCYVVYYDPVGSFNRWFEAELENESSWLTILMKLVYPSFFKEGSVWNTFRTCKRMHYKAFHFCQGVYEEGRNDTERIEMGRNIYIKLIIHDIVLTTAAIAKSHGYEWVNVASTDEHFYMTMKSVNKNSKTPTLRIRLDAEFSRNYGGGCGCLMLDAYVNDMQSNTERVPQYWGPTVPYIRYDVISRFFKDLSKTIGNMKK